MRKMLAVRRASLGDAGMSTAEYAVGTIAAVGFGSLLVKLLTSPEAQQLLWLIIQKSFAWLF